MTVTERNDSWVKVHYVGYSSAYDEWKDVSELETLGEAEGEPQSTELTPLPALLSLQRSSSKDKTVYVMPQEILTFYSNMHAIWHASLVA